MLIECSVGMTVGCKHCASTVLAMPVSKVSCGVQPISLAIFSAFMAYLQSWPGRSVTKLISFRWGAAAGFCWSIRSQMVRQISMLAHSLMPPIL